MSWSVSPAARRPRDGTAPGAAPPALTPLIAKDVQRHPVPPQRTTTPEGEGEGSPRGAKAAARGPGASRQPGVLDATQLLGRLKQEERYSPWHPTGARAPRRASSPRADCQTEDVAFFGLPLLGKSLFWSPDPRAGRAEHAHPLLPPNMPPFNWLIKQEVQQGAVRTASPRRVRLQSPRFRSMQSPRNARPPCIPQAEAGASVSPPNAECDDGWSVQVPRHMSQCFLSQRAIPE
jgi:hypothetical protein